MSKVMSPSWIEVNLHLWGHPASQDFMVENVFPLVDKILSRYPCLSWHYFLEPALPPPRLGPLIEGPRG